jgi:transposase
LFRDVGDARENSRVQVIDLPGDLASAHAMIREMHARIHDLDARNADLKHQLDLMAKRLYGRRSEQLDPAQLQMAFQLLQAEMEAKGLEVVAAPEAPEASRRERRLGHGRSPLPKHLARERRVIEPSAEDLTCRCCGKAKARIGEETSEQLEYVPATFKVIETVRPKYACPTCKEGVTVALAPRSPVPRSKAGPGLLAHVVVSKYADHVPLNRQAEIFRRVGVDLSRQTLCDWVGQLFLLLEPVERALWASVLSSEVLCADETPVKVLDTERRECARGYVWVYKGDRDEVVCDFSMGRKSEAPTKALEHFERGYLVCDAYAGYDEAERTKPALVRCGCMAHARRKVYEAQDSDPERALLLLALLRRLYDVEAKAKALPATTRQERIEVTHALRQEESRPLAAQLEEHVARYRDQVLPKSPIGQAVGYMKNQWTYLTRFLEDGAIPIDNNEAERVIRPIAVGRGNWTFVGSEGGGEWAARLFGLMGTCRLQGVDPYAWTKDVLERVRDHPPERMAELTPRNWKSARTGIPVPT